MMSESTKTHQSEVEARGMECETLGLAFPQIVVRLKETLEAEKAEQLVVEEDGYDAGRVWATQRATCRQLQDLTDYAFSRHGCNHDLDFVIFRVLNPRANSCPCQVHSFWEGVAEGLHTKIDDPVFVHAFVEAAVDVWEDVKPCVIDAA